MLRGDEVGVLLGYFIATEMPETISGKAFANSIVSSSALGRIAKLKNIEFHETLTGFKWLAKIPNLGFGYEEALGYAVDAATCNDKDGVSAALMLAQCLGVLKERGITVIEYLDQIWNEIGFHRTEQISIRVSNLDQVDKVLHSLRADSNRDRRLPRHTFRRFALSQWRYAANKWIADLARGWRENNYSALGD